MQLPTPTLLPIPPGTINLADYERHARERMDDNAWAYFSGGAADEITLRANASAWQNIRLAPRVLRPLAHGHTRTQLLGQALAHPILAAPMAFQCMAQESGEIGMAYACAAMGAGMVVATQASLPIDAIAQSYFQDAAHGPLWYQLYLQHDRGFNAELLQRLEAAGYQAIVVTVDAPVSGVRDRERHAQFKRPTHIRAVNLNGLPKVSPVELTPADSPLFDDLLRHAPTWDDIAWLQSKTQLPIILKGIAHPLDAQQAVAAGASAIICSNHGGRTLDTMPATAQLLPGIVTAVNGAVPVLVDGGIRRGTDVLKAMALGASAVLVGRPLIYGLATAGAAGVAHVLRLLRDEFEAAMALTGCKTLADINPALIFDGPR
ncbi:alpha-hydroxy acid oxidase [Comamonas sp. J-3]|uniref:alpha-hydroxy acid oxidase n=1 Tax=Comamonas trifloxystrobinivorans TaxID=3350256 RepID=UPI00372C6F3E